MLSRRVAIVDYGAGNLFSVASAFQVLGAEVDIITEPSRAQRASHVVLPGVGAFAHGMSVLKKQGFEEYFQELASRQSKPLLGICLGMQLLADSGDEGGLCEGLGLIPGYVARLNPLEAQSPIPHVGWNSLLIQGEQTLLRTIPEKSDFYFVHSYVFEPEISENILGVTEYGGYEFCSVVGKEMVFGVQFHPEKSSKVGLQVLENFLKQ